MLGDGGHSKDCFWRAYRMDAMGGGDVYYLGLNDGEDMWKVDERTARHYIDD